MRFPTMGHDWILSEERKVKLRETYPTLDVDRELQKAMLWCTVNPRKRKTANGMPRFLVAWLNRASSDLRPRPNAPVPIRPPAVTYEWICPHTPKCPHRTACSIVAMRKRA